MIVVSRVWVSVGACVCVCCLLKEEKTDCQACSFAQCGVWNELLTPISPVIWVIRLNACVVWQRFDWSCGLTPTQETWCALNVPTIPCQAQLQFPVNNGHYYIYYKTIVFVSIYQHHWVWFLNENGI